MKIAFPESMGGGAPVLIPFDKGMLNMYLIIIVNTFGLTIIIILIFKLKD